MKTHLLTTIPLIAVMLSCFSSQLIAEEIIIPVGQQSVEKQAMERPQNGINKDQVEQRFGKPSDWSDPVGEPPITSWEYANFVVYFEHDLVLHSVLKRN